MGYNNFKLLSMFQKILIIIFITISASSYAANEQRIAVVDVQTIMENSLAVNAIRKEAEKISQDLQTEFNTKAKELKELEKNLSAEREKLTEEAFQKKVESFNKKVTDIQKKLHDKKVRLEQAHAKAISKVNEVALKIIDDIGTKGKYSFILPSTQVLFRNEKLDITKEVLTRLNSRIPIVKLKF